MKDNWTDTKLENCVDYYANNKWFLSLPINTQCYLRNPKQYPKRSVEQHLEWLNTSKYRIKGILYPFIKPDPSWGSYSV